MYLLCVEHQVLQQQRVWSGRGLLETKASEWKKEESKNRQKILNHGADLTGPRDSVVDIQRKDCSSQLLHYGPIFGPYIPMNKVLGMS